jgi:soluble lytic murein transglycosylase-like protein
MPATARRFGVDPYDASSSIWGAAKYLQALYRQFSDWKWAVAAYNWGEGAVDKFRRDGFVMTKGGTRLTRPPAETRSYVAYILPGESIA